MDLKGSHHLEACEHACAQVAAHGSLHAIGKTYHLKSSLAAWQFECSLPEASNSHDVIVMITSCTTLVALHPPLLAHQIGTTKEHLLEILYGPLKPQLR